MPYEKKKKKSSSYEKYTSHRDAEHGDTIHV
jgi:hypothetical protein